ncbi:MAG TPA: VWA domain-containing protein [Gaiellaceae bacterium]|jgi:Ca-activated chloride channel family protein
MSFGHPFLLLTLLALPLIVLAYLLAERRRMRYALRFTNLDVLASVAGGRSWRRFVPPLLALLAVAALCVAVARPRVNTLVPSQRATVILVIDVSGSMTAHDVKPSRLAAAADAVRTFLDKAPKQLRVGLIEFAGEPQVAAPVTTDHDLVRDSLDQLGYFSGFGGTAIGDALAAAVRMGQAAVAGDVLSQGQTIAYRTAAAPPARTQGTDGLVSILFLSDGSQTRGELQPSEGAARAKAAGIPVYTVALGTPNGQITRSFGFFQRSIPVPPDPATLSAIARTTGGKFFAAHSAKALESAYAKLGSRLGRRPGRSEITYAFLAAAAALLVAAGVLSARWSSRLP